VAFGPRNTVNFTKDMPKKMRKLALAGILTVKAKNEQLIGVVDNALDAIKTKEAIAMLQNIGLTNKKTLIIIPEKNEIIEKSMRNIARTKTIQAMYVNPVDLLHYDKVLVFAGTLEKWDVLFA
jgi:large subunit ribosomal protein L4